MNQKMNAKIEYGKCLKCRLDLPCEGFVDGLCADCLLEKHYCEECENCELSDYKDVDKSLEFAKCLASPKKGEGFKRSMLSERYDEEPVEYYFCTSERTADQCENFKFHVGA